MLSKRITCLRENYGISQAQLAQKLYVSASTIGMYEQGRRTPSLEVLILLSEFFDVSLDYLITGSEHRSHFTPSENPIFPPFCPCGACILFQGKYSPGQSRSIQVER